MKTKVFITAIVLCFIFIPAICQKSAFAGEWKLNKEKTTLADSRLYLAKVYANVRNDSLLTTRVYENEYGEQYPFDENIPLNGKESKITIYDMPRTSKAVKNSDGSLSLESKTVFYGDSGEQNLIANEIWKIVNGGKNLTIEAVNKMAGQDFKGVFIYDKVK